MIFVWVPAYVQVDKCLHSKKRSPAWHWMLAKLGISAGAGSLGLSSVFTPHLEKTVLQQKGQTAKETQTQIQVASALSVVEQPKNTHLQGC